MDSVVDWSTSGTQGENGWTYGDDEPPTENNERIVPSDAVYNPDDFKAFEGPDWRWRGNSWRNATWAFLPEINVDKNSPIPNGGGSTTFRMQYAMRR